MTAILTRPDGVEYSRHISNGETARAGGHVFNMPTGPLVPRGTWQLALFTDVDAPALASTTFLIEDFLPERIDFTLTLPDAPLRLKDGTVLTADTRYLFGAPAADLPIEGEVLVQATAGLNAYPGYSFGRHNARFNPVVESLPYDLRTDKAGIVRIPVTFPTLKNVSQPLEALFTVRIAEGSGRPVERRLTQRLAPDGPMIGIKPMFDDVVSNNSNADFQIIAIDQNEAQTPMQVRWT
ncbi:MAG: alpha-2-macroglobulin family protein, partial [Marinosulfonomonas sp.]|nr:alpha-2-macroglobulin family protein [Marinosulfonomonas sp.]